MIIYFLRVSFGNACAFSEGLRKQFSYYEGFNFNLFSFKHRKNKDERNIYKTHKFPQLPLVSLKKKRLVLKKSWFIEMGNIPTTAGSEMVYQ